MYNKDVMKKQNLYRTQVLLEPEQYVELNRLAEAEGISLSALLRRMVAQALGEQRERELARAAETLLDLYYTDAGLTGYSSAGGGQRSGG